MDFAYRNDETLIKKINVIKEGDSQTDAIQDMANLSVLAKANLAPLEAINFDLTLLDKAVETTDKMGGLPGAVNNRMYVDDKTKDHVKSYSNKYNRNSTQFFSVML